VVVSKEDGARMLVSKEVDPRMMSKVDVTKGGWYGRWMGKMLL
jgi:hypothetical protein